MLLCQVAILIPALGGLDRTRTGMGGRRCDDAQGQACSRVGHRVIPCANTREQASSPSWLDFATDLFCGGYWSGRAMGHEADIHYCPD